MSVIRSAAKVGGFTSISRVLGFIRDQLVAFTLGTGGVAEAFFVAQRFPNLFRTLFAEGAFNSAFVPLFARKVEGEGERAAHRFARDVFSALLAWVLLFTVIAIAAMPWLIYAIAPGFKGDPAKIALATLLTQICFPYLLFMSLTALQGGVLNSLHRFTAAAAAPILLNIVMILSNMLAYTLGSGNSPLTGYIFAVGVTLSGVAQYALLAVACSRAGMPLTPRLPRLTPDVKLVIKRSVPGIISGGIMQINLVIGTMIATSIPSAVAYLYYADRLYQLPLGVIGVAIGVVLLPTLSRKLRAGDEWGALDASNRAIEFSLFLTLPAAAALMVIGAPILHTVFEHGAFHAGDTLAVAPAVAAYAAGLPAYSLTKVFQPGFYAREDTRTPMNFAIVSVVVNIVLSLALSRFMGHVGIALAATIAAWINAGQLYFRLRKLGHFTFDRSARFRLSRMILSTCIMAAALFDVGLLMDGAFDPGAHILRAIIGLALLVAAGIISYFGASQLTGAWRLSELRGALRRS
ncbi:murein biosynthesis integral membrane protein MurJ [Aestuariivirga litoralis]|uniref:murein biosynthesis integral membrane protein MurJ n=1 Tax=Aestuariivirga litoralis TaxID=2650924 RepID=UPI0018C52D22|nr:murein biosynthesis integral membrane protein MurJ [Aestuariivirga litoralis]MBG1233834.1 murein biosynthesis integral membrane protein MurJ [Aestuariivirga litoralis]